MDNKILSSALFSYRSSLEIIGKIAEDNGYTPKKAYCDFEAMLQWMLLCVAAEDGRVMKVEIDFIKEFANYVDITLESGVSWYTFQSLSGERLKDVINKANESIYPTNSSTLINIMKCATANEKIDLEAHALAICMKMAEIDGDLKGSLDFENEWKAGMRIFYSLTEVYLPPKKETIFYGFNTPYSSNVLTIELISVTTNEEPEVCEITFKITNNQSRNVRIWIKDYGVWLENADTEIVEGYFSGREISGFKTATISFYVSEDNMKNHLWPIDRAEYSVNEYDEDECFSEFVFMLAFDFDEPEDFDVSHWVISSDEVDTSYGEDWAYEFDENNKNDENDEDCEDDNHYDKDENDLDTSEWHVESLLRKEGYTVSQRENLSDSERQKILNSVISRKIMSKYEIISFLELQISLRKNNSLYDIAISKWTRDIDFIKIKLQ